MKKIKKLLSIFICAVMVFAALPLTSGITATAATSGYYTYTVSNGEVTITECDRSISGAVTIPSLLNGYPVTRIEDYAFNFCTSIKSVIIPESVTYIGDCAFRYCTALTSITLGNNITNIGDDAFYYTLYYNYTKNWENNLLYIGNYLVEAKTNIAGEYKIKSGTKNIANATFKECKSLTGIIIPDGVTNIGDFAFYKCSSLENVTIPNSVIRIGRYAFNYCSLLTNLIINNGVTKIDEGAFGDCSSLTNIEIPESVTDIGNSAFEYCSSLTNITLPDSITNMGSWIFYATGYYNQESNWENGVLYIDKYLIAANESLKGTYRIKEGTKVISESAFNRCLSLTKIIITESITHINNYAFQNCYELKSVIMFNNVASIGEFAFKNCVSLKSITISDKITNINSDSFYGCSSLKDVYYYGSKEEWNNITVSSGNSNLTSSNIIFNYVYEEEKPTSETLIILCKNLFDEEENLEYDYYTDGIIDIRDLIALKNLLLG